MSNRLRSGSAVLFALLSGVAATGAGAQSTGNYPAKPIRIVSPLVPGGSADAIARAVGDILSEGLGQQVVTDNRPGANGIIGVELVARATPDGYTLLLSSGANVAINTAIYGAKLPFDVVRDLVPVTEVVSQSFVAHVSPNYEVKSIKDLIALAKTKPGVINYRSEEHTSELQSH